MAIHIIIGKAAGVAALVPSTVAFYLSTLVGGAMLMSSLHQGSVGRSCCEGSR